MSQQQQESSEDIINLVDSDNESPEYIYTPTAFNFINDWESRMSLIGGPMNTGKGAASAFKLFTYIFKKAPVVKGNRTCTFFAVRHDYRALRETIIAEIYKWFPPGTVFPREGKLTSQTNTIRIQLPKTETSYGVDAKIILISLKNFNLTDVLSYNVTGMQWSELQEEEDPDVFETLFDRTGRGPYRDMPKLFFGDFNYTDDTHWIYKRFVTERDNTVDNLNWKLHRIPAVIDLNEQGEYFENPEAEIPSHKRNYDYWWDIVHRGGDGNIRRKVIGDFAIVPRGTPVYPSFKDSMIVSDKKPIEGRTLLFGVDPGNRNNLAIVIGQVDLHGKLRVLAALSPEAHMDFQSFSEDILMPYVMSEIYPYMCPDGGKITTYGWRDPSDAEDKETNKNTGDVIKEVTGINTVKCTTNDVSLRVNALTSLIRNDRLEINQSADVLVRAMKGGYYIDNNGKPDKGRYSHIGNALEYLAYGMQNHSGSYDNELMLGDDLPLFS